VKKENFQATVDGDGRFRLFIDDLTTQAQIFDMQLLKFQEGNFPTSINTITYTYLYNDLKGEEFISSDLNDPKRNNGLIKITHIDRENMLVSGSFSSLLMPAPLNQHLLNSFRITGDFQNIPYERNIGGELGFIYANINGQDINDLDIVSNAKGDIVDGNIILDARSAIMRKRAMKVSFSKGLKAGNYDYSQVNVQYTSENGVVYYSNAEDASLSGSYFKIDNIASLAESKATYKGKYVFKLKSKAGDIVTLNFGDYSATLLLKESNPKPKTGGGEGELPKL